MDAEKMRAVVITKHGDANVLEVLEVENRRVRRRTECWCACVRRP